MEPTDKEREIAIALLDVLFAGRIRDFDEERAGIVADALARHRVEVQQAQREACAVTLKIARGVDPQKARIEVNQLVVGCAPLDDEDEWCCAILAAGRGS